MELGFQQIPIKSLIPSETNPRQIHNEKSIDEMAESIRNVGVLEPILVRPVGKVLEVVAGSRRLAGAKKAGITAIPAIVREMTDVQALEVQTIENLQRENIHPLDEGEGYNRLMNQAGWDTAKIADRIGKSVTYVHQRIALANLIVPAKKAFVDGTLALTHALMLCRLQPNDQAAAFKECFESVYVADKKEKISVSIAELKRWIARNMIFHLKKAPWILEDADLVPEAGTCKICPKRSGANPTLFSDMAGADLCTDRNCFNTKMKAWFIRKENELTEKGHQVKRIATDWLSPGDLKKLNALGNGDYRRLLKKDPKCDHAVKGLVVTGDDRGHVYDICPTPKCSVHGGRNSSSGESAKDRAARLAEQKLQAHLNCVRNEAIKQIIAVKKPWTLDDMVLVVNSYWNEVWSEAHKTILARHEWKTETAFRKAVSEMKEDQLWTMMMEISLTCLAASEGGNYPKPYPEKFLTVCQRFGIDFKKLSREMITKEG